MTTDEMRPWEAEILGLAGIAADADTMTEVPVYFDTPEWHALIEWLEFHHVDPKLIPAGTRISRDECGRCIRYLRYVTGDDGQKILFPATSKHPDWHFEHVPTVEQGEAPPLPYPDLIARQLR